MKKPVIEDFVWQIGSDIRDFFHLLSKMDDKYFTDTEFSIPVMDIDISEKSVMGEVFERMEQYRPDRNWCFYKMAVTLSLDLCKFW